MKHEWIRPSDWDLTKHLPPLDAQILDAYYRKKLTQCAIGEQFFMSQAAVSYRLQIARRRVKFLRKFPQLARSHVRKLLRQLNYSAFHVSMFTTLYATTCQSAAARAVKVTQGNVRYQLYLMVKRLAKLVRAGRKDLKLLHQGFVLIQRHPAILHEYPAPPWSGVHR